MLHDAGMLSDLGGLVLLATAMVAPPLHDPMTARELHWRMIGNSLRFDANTIEHIAFDGRINGRRDGKPYTGRWELQGDAYCTSYGAAAPVCFRVSMNGDRVTFRAKGRKPRVAQLVAGNPLQL